MLACCEDYQRLGHGLIRADSGGGTTDPVVAGSDPHRDSLHLLGGVIEHELGVNPRGER